MAGVRTWVGVAIAALIGVPAARADVTSVVVAGRDNTLYENASGDYSNGSGPYLFAGTTAMFVRQRGVLWFDVGSAVPSGATVTGARLSLHMSRTITSTEVVSVHRILADWGEGGSSTGPGVGPGANGGAGATSQPGDATWIHRFYPGAGGAGALWANAGGDFLADPSADTGVGGVGSYSWTGTGLVADVQAWVDGAAGNYGWMLRGNESVDGTSKRFDSREIDEAAFRPALEITWVPAPGAAAGIVVWAGAALRRRRA